MKRQLRTIGLALVLTGFPAALQAQKVWVYGPKAEGGLSVLKNVTGTFWRDPQWAQRFGLTAEQEKRMDEIFRQHRLKLIDLDAALEKEELILQPLIGSTQPSPQDEAKISTQIDRIADTRAALEKANSKMLLSLLQVLNEQQWTMLWNESKKRSPYYLDFINPRQ